MALSILNFRTVASQVKKLAVENSILESRAFLEFCINLYLPNISEDEIAESIIDGSDDRGIDAIYIDDEDDPKTVYLFQSKYTSDEDKFGNAFPGNELMKMRDAISRLILAKPREIREANRFLLDKLSDIRKLGNAKFCIVFCSNFDTPIQRARSEFEDFIKEKGNEHFEVEYFSLEKIVECLTPETTKRINTAIPFKGEYFEWSIGSARVVVGRMHGVDLAKLRAIHGKELFDRNVRGYLGKKKDSVNEDIYNSASNQNIAPNFFFLNNGITMVCSKLDFLAVDEAPEISVEDLQIVNGGQTTNSLYEANIAGLLSDKVYVLVRLVQTGNKDLLNQITEATNTQTRVTSRDLRSNDSVQRQIEQSLRAIGYFYEARKNKYKDNPAARGKRIDAEVGAQAYYAFFCQKPADAKNKKRELFGVLYDEIFTDTLNPEDILLACKTLEFVRKHHSELRNKYSFIKYAEYHSVTMLSDLGIRSQEELDNPETMKLYRKILQAAADVVNEELELRGDDYSHRLLFINPETIGRIKAAYNKK